MPKLLPPGYQIVVALVGCLLSVILCLSLIHVIYKCCIHMKMYWCTCCKKTKDDKLDKVKRRRPKPIAHSSEIEWASKKPVVSHSVAIAHYGFIDARLHGYFDHRHHGRKHGDVGGDGGDIEFLDKISSSSSSDDSDYLEYYSSQSLNANTTWDQT